MPSPSAEAAGSSGLGLWGEGPSDGPPVACSGASDSVSSVPSSPSSGPLTTLVRPGRILASSNQWASPGAWMRSGRLGVGRIAEALVTFSSNIELTRVDFPDPVDPPTTATSGASRFVIRGRT